MPDAMGSSPTPRFASVARRARSRARNGTAPGENGGIGELSGDSYDNTRKLDGIHWRHVRFIEQFKAPYDGRWLMMSDVCKHCVRRDAWKCVPPAPSFAPSSTPS